MVGTTWWFCWISDLSFFKMLFIFRRNDIRRTLLLPSGLVVTQQLPGIQVKWPRVIGAVSPRYRDQKRLCVAWRRTSVFLFPAHFLFRVIWASLPLHLQTEWWQNLPCRPVLAAPNQRGNVVCFLCLWNPPAERGRVYERKIRWVSSASDHFPPKQEWHFLVTAYID